jgi:hypothetical protein
MDELESDGQDASLARKMLKYAEHVRTIHLAEQQRLEKALGEKSMNLKRWKGE